jgi:hypothetical protein
MCVSMLRTPAVQIRGIRLSDDPDNSAAKGFCGEEYSGDELRCTLQLATKPTAYFL